MRRAYQCTLYEAQDVLRENANVDMIELEPEPGFWTKERWLRRLVYHDVSQRLVLRNPGLRKVTLTRDYDLFVVACQNHWDLLYINAIDRWWEHCRTSVCWMDEMWAADVSSCRNWMSALRRFDYVFIGFAGTAHTLSEAMGKRCGYLPMGIDTLRFTPYPEPPNRVVDVYSVGRRSEALHNMLLEVANKGELFYLYDTLRGMANMEVRDPQQHRQFFANIAKRSRYFVVAPAKADLTDETSGQVEFGYRYYEAAASGAVMVGQAVDNQAFEAAFGWPDSVIAVRPDGSDVVDVLRELDSQPTRLSRIGRRNAAEALRRHDWGYRWSELLKECGFEAPAGLVQRETRLRALAAHAIQD